MSLPTGTVTFLFTDIEGSTQRWDEHPAAMDAAVKRHDVLLRATIKQHRGYVFKTVGDAFCAAFSGVSDAVAAAVAAQYALNGGDFSAVDGLRVRMGLHVGETSERDGDYFGPTVNRVTRLVSIGHGGQVLISSAVQEKIEAHLPGGVSLIDLGLRRLKDLSQPEQVWQLTVAGLPTEFPPLNSLDARPNNLPVQLTPLIGRERDLNDVRTLVGRHRFVTISGAGGVGKTRVALQVGADLIDRFDHGVWFADLAPITDPELVSSVIAKALGMSQQEGRRVDESIPLWLKRKKLLLILDNCEHVLEAAARITEEIVRNCADVRLLATSRQALGISGEVVYKLPSLATPNKLASLPAKEALEYGGIALFTERAKAVNARFGLTDDNAPIVAEICRRLDGIPLAIELAAARAKVLSIPNLARHLNERFKLLTEGSRTAFPRQKTLGALIDWSYNLLTTKEQTLFNRLAIFAGSFSLKAPTVVCSETADEMGILDLLSSLADKSLVVAEPTEDRERYRLLESTRAYALEKLCASGEHESLARRHAEYFRDQAQMADEGHGTGSTLAWLSRVEIELDNYRAALVWTLTQANDVVAGGAIAGALEQLWFRGGLSAEGRYWIAYALERLNQAEYPTIAARLWRAVASLSTAKRMCDAAERALGLYESLRDRRGEARARSRKAGGLFQMGCLEEASAENLRALADLHACGDERSIAGCLMRQAAICYTRGDVSGARDLSAKALAAFKALGDESGSATVLGNLGEIEFAEGRTQEALSYASEALEMDSRRGDDTISLGGDHSNRAAYQIALGDLEGALASARQALHFARRTQVEAQMAWVLQHFALLAALRGKSAVAARLIGYVDVQLKELGEEREPTEKWGYQNLIATLQEYFSESQLEELAAEGRAWSQAQAVEAALRV